MGMEFWLIPLLVIFVASVLIFYLVIRHSGGSGVRDSGRTAVDKPVKEEASKAEWNYYH